MIYLKKSIKFLISAASIIAAGYALISNRQLRVTEYNMPVSKLPKSFDGKKILLIADLHKKRYGDRFDNLINSCAACEPDYIFFAGDLYSRDEGDMLPKITLMKRLVSIAPTYYVLGNHETDNMDNCEALCFRMKQTGVKVLRNDMAYLLNDGRAVAVYGAQLPQRYYRNKDFSHKNLPKLNADVLERLMGKTDKNVCNFLISHNPFPFEAYAEWGADAVFSGHCHGGIIRLPLIGGLLSPERKFFPRYTKGIYETEGKNAISSMALTVGLGKFRLNNPAEIMLITLVKR